MATSNLTRELLAYVAGMGCERAHAVNGEWPEACGDCLPCLAYDYFEERQPHTFAEIRRCVRDYYRRKHTVELDGVVMRDVA